VNSPPKLDNESYDPPAFVKGRIYERGKLHERYGGNPQRGISPSAKYGIVFLFTGPKGEKYGYKDGWQGSVYQYYGEGKNRDMTLDYGNKAIIEHIQNHKDLHLFEQAGKRMVRYVDQMIYISHEFRELDGNNVPRNSIVFNLAPFDAVRDQGNDEEMAHQGGLEALRTKAYDSAEESPAVSQAIIQIRERSRHVREYTLNRANGVCEWCLARAPFLDTSDRPFLEVHHILSLSDGGPDDPKHVAALCPNCHRRTHYGKDSVKINKRLQERVRRLESD
jgi:5-methylcytosine-specific restriction protein A